MAIHIGRRDFITLLGGAAAAWPCAARAQQPTMPVIGFLNGGSEGYAAYLVPFRQGLKDAGYLEGQNVTIEYRWAEGSYDRLPALAADLVQHHVTVIAVNTPAVRAAQAATKTIPIVFVTGADPVALGFVSSLNRPGGNITGVASLADEVGPKRLEVVRELLPTTSVIALLINPTNPTAETISKDVQASARVLGQVVHILNASTEREIDTAFERIAELRAGALLVTNDAFFNNRPGQFIALAARHALPAIYPWREFVLAGGLMSYGTSIAYLYRELGIYVGRVLKGDKPADLSVQQSTKAELVINLKTANALGLTFPITLLGRADEVIE
jgi:putative ABC transport system substrate-binding protein